MNENILNYIRQYRNIYTREAVTGELLKAGYQPADIESAWQTIEAGPLPNQPPPWMTDLGQQPPGPLPGQELPPNPFSGQQFSSEPPSSSGQQSSFGSSPSAGEQSAFGSRSLSESQPPPDWQQPPPGWQPPPPYYGPQTGPQMYANVDQYGRPIPAFTGQRSRESQRYWATFIFTIIGVIFGVPLVASITNSALLYFVVGAGIVIASIVLWNRDRPVAKGLLYGLSAAVLGSVVLIFVLIVIVAGICIATGSRF